LAGGRAGHEIEQWNARGVEAQNGIVDQGFMHRREHDGVGPFRNRAFNESDLLVHVVRPLRDIVHGRGAKLRRDAIGAEPRCLVGGVGAVLGEDGDAESFSPASWVYARPRLAPVFLIVGDILILLNTAQPTGRSLTMRKILVRLLPLLGMLLCSFAAHAQTANYPSRSIRIVVPYAAGGIADLLARTVAQHLGPELGQTMVIENQAGAGGHLGGSAVAKAPPDGYTLVLATIAHNAASSMYGNLNYNPEKDLKPVIVIAESAGVLVVNASVSSKTVRNSSLMPAQRLTLAPPAADQRSIQPNCSRRWRRWIWSTLPRRAPAMTDLLSATSSHVEKTPTALPHSQRPHSSAGVTSPKRSPCCRNADDRGSRCPRLCGGAWYTISVASRAADIVIVSTRRSTRSSVRSWGSVGANSGDAAGRLA
jgi:hypothetical protein